MIPYSILFIQKYQPSINNAAGHALDGSDGVIKLLEVNPNPGWCWDGKLAYMAKLQGWDYPTLLAAILNAAHVRLNKKN